MKKKSKEKTSLNSLRLQIGELINKAVDAGLHNIPHQSYDSIQNELKKAIIEKFYIIENELVDFIKWQESAYLFFDNLLTKFYNHDSVLEKDVVELILNTDRSLLNKNISINDKISRALQLLQTKTSDAKKTMLDIYYIHKTVDLEGYKIGWQVPPAIADYILNVIDNYFTANPSYATSNAYYLLKEISDKKTFDDAFYLYYINMDLLLDVTFIKVNNGQEGTFTPVDLYHPFLSVKNIKENLYSPFYGGKVNFVSGMSTQRIKNMTMTQRNISLDANTVSYIRTMADGHLDMLPSDHIKELIRNIDIIKEATSFDYMPYILENYVFSPSNEERILKTVKSVEQCFYPNEEWIRVKYYEIAKSIFKEKWAIERIKKDYYIGYALLLLICFINFKFYKIKTLQKLENFCLYMDKIFFLFREPFVEVAFNFFEHGNQYRFFKKIQINAKNILKNLRNMAWDIYHLGYLEVLCSTGDKGADLFVPYFYCFDKGLLELKECFDLETLFVNERTGERISFYHKHSYPIDIIEKYMSIEKEKIRRKNFSHDNILMQIEYLENEINSLW